MIYVHSPSIRGAARTGSIIKADEFVATNNAPCGPFGYGKTADEAVSNLRQKLHEEIDAMRVMNVSYDDENPVES